MTQTGDEKKRPTLTEKAKSEKAAREARLAQALRDNLRRRRRPGAVRDGEGSAEDKTQS